MDMFSPLKIGSLLIPNRIIRSATFEGMADESGFVTNRYIEFYDNLSKQDIGAIICGFSYISTQGKAMQPGQIGVDSPDKVPMLKKLVETVHQNNSIVFMQIAHAGRQTLERSTHQKTVSASAVRSIYFNQKPEELSLDEIELICQQFGDAALYCKQAGFDGIQLHAAHGYLIHQFITPAINKRKDSYGVDRKTGIGAKFLEDVISNVRLKCGNDYPVLLKLSASDDIFPKFNLLQFTNLLQCVDKLPVDGMEISYGTMDYALNIFRGDIPVKIILAHNPIYKTDNRLYKILWKTLLLPFLRFKLKPFAPTYNLSYAQLAKTFTTKPVICVGGFRNKQDIDSALKSGIDFVSLCRPFLCEPDFLKKLAVDSCYQSQCTNCNICAIMCDSKAATQCFFIK